MDDTEYRLEWYYSTARRHGWYYDDIEVNTPTTSRRDPLQHDLDAYACSRTSTQGLQPTDGQNHMYSGEYIEGRAETVTLLVEGQTRSKTTWALLGTPT